MTKSSLALVAIITSMSVQACGQVATQHPAIDVGAEDPRYAAGIAAGRVFLDSLAAAFRVPGLTMAVAMNQELVWAEARGYADVQAERPMRTTTPIRIHSVSKALTSVLLAKLVQRGLLDLDVPVRQYVPLFPARHGPVTLRQLAGHLGGVRHYRSDEEVHNQRRFASVLESVEPFAEDSLVAPPGHSYSYSSYGYNLIGAAIAAACGMSFADCLDQNVLTPFGLEQTYLDGIRAPSRPESSYYELQNGSLVDAPSMDLSNRWPGGGMISTATDLVRFGLAVLDDDHLPPDLRSVLFAPQTTVAGDTIPYGIGWATATGPGNTPVVMHQGGSTGGMSFLAMLPEHGFVFAIMLNVNGDLGDAPPPVAQAMQALMTFLGQSASRSPVN